MAGSARSAGGPTPGAATLPSPGWIEALMIFMPVTRGCNGPRRRFAAIAADEPQGRSAALIFIFYAESQVTILGGCQNA